MLRLCSLLCLAALLGACNKSVVLKQRYADTPVPPPPDYSLEDTWAALPTKQDNADETPGGKKAQRWGWSGGIFVDYQKDARIDVFFIHPTIYTYKPTTQYLWNGDVLDSELNTRVENSSILHQASVFNGTGKIYAPRYRQAHYYSYLTPNQDDAKQAFDTAYADVKAAFTYYLEHYNDGRPFIIASHSQGTQHGERLIREMVDTTALRDKLVAAYLVGMPVPPDAFSNIPPCALPESTGCFVVWNTFAYGYYPDYYENGLNESLVINPLTFSMDKPKAKYGEHRGGVTAKYELTGLNKVDAEVHEGLLWIHPPRIFGARLLRIKNWHRADYNLFWMDIRFNSRKRGTSYLQAIEE